jgi:hypothetical protein
MSGIEAVVLPLRLVMTARINDTSQATIAERVLGLPKSY